MLLKAFELLIILAAVLAVVALYKRGRASQDAQTRNMKSHPTIPPAASGRED